MFLLYVLYMQQIMQVIIFIIHYKTANLSIYD